jgi:hypothetical protein
MEKDLIFRPSSDGREIFRESAAGLTFSPNGSADCGNLAAQTANRTFLAEPPTIIPVVIYTPSRKQP